MMATAYVEIMDAQTGVVTPVLRSNQHIEAPNWSPDGEALIVNAQGLLYQIALNQPELQPIQTGPYVRLNNDHGPSPDGQWLAFSDKVETGKSCIYVQPAAGGEAKRLTQNVPSWFHAWSPDSASVLYPCVRDETFGIARCDLSGDETVLISGPGHYDGPDITPDGHWIWFNSDRGGTMALWRMRADGSDPEQMTNTDRDDWFPHPSPNGRDIVYLSYPPRTHGHPFGLHVELRMIPSDGGPPVMLRRIFGGQGSLNVPCWAPDGHRFAYVRYEN